MVSQSIFRGQKQPLFPIFPAVLGIFVAVGFTVGCSLGPEPIDEYPAFGGIFQRLDQSEGRVGSIFSDPNLNGRAEVIVDESVAVSEPEPAATISDEETIEAILESDVVGEEAFWGGRQQPISEWSEQDAEIIFEEQID
jgi:hypothetical protein